MNQIKVASLFNKKHFPYEHGSIIDITDYDTIESVLESKDYFDWLIETAKQTFNSSIDIRHKFGAIIYPGKHPESKHDVESLKKHGIPLYYLMDNPYNRATADFIFRQIESIYNSVPANTLKLYLGYLDEPIARREIPQNLTIGILGVGNVGSRVLEQSIDRGWNVKYFSRASQNKFNEMGAIHYDSPISLAKECDILVVCLPKTSQTKSFVNDQILEVMKPGSCIVSVAAGGVIDEEALFKRIEKGDIYAAIDTYENEKEYYDKSTFCINSKPVLDLVLSGRLLLTPHTAYKLETTTKEIVALLTGAVINLAAKQAPEDEIVIKVPNESTGSESEYLVKKYQ